MSQHSHDLQEGTPMSFTDCPAKLMESFDERSPQQGFADLGKCP
jgi:hypothetical protein